MEIVFSFNLREWYYVKMKSWCATHRLRIFFFAYSNVFYLRFLLSNHQIMYRQTSFFTSKARYIDYSALGPIVTLFTHYFRQFFKKFGKESGANVLLITRPGFSPTSPVLHRSDSRCNSYREYLSCDRSSFE